MIKTSVWAAKGAVLYVPEALLKSMKTTGPILNIQRTAGAVPPVLKSAPLMQ